MGEWRGQRSRPGQLFRSLGFGAGIAAVECALTPSVPLTNLDDLTVLHAEEILDRYPDLPRNQRETKIIQELPAIFIYGIGWPLEDGFPNEMRAADYDDWVTPTAEKNGKLMRGLSGDFLELPYHRAILNDEIPLSIGGGIG